MASNVNFDFYRINWSRKKEKKLCWCCCYTYEYSSGCYFLCLGLIDKNLHPIVFGSSFHHLLPLFVVFLFYYCSIVNYLSLIAHSSPLSFSPSLISEIIIHFDFKNVNNEGLYPLCIHCLLLTTNRRPQSMRQEENFDIMFLMLCEKLKNAIV